MKRKNPDSLVKLSSGLGLCAAKTINPPATELTDCTAPGGPGVPVMCYAARDGVDLKVSRKQ